MVSPLPHRIRYVVAAAGACALAVVVVISPADAKTFNPKAHVWSARLPERGAAPGVSARPSPPVGSPARTPTAKTSVSWGSTSSPAARAAATLASTGVMFDDFAYQSVSDAAFTKEWSVRGGQGAPGQAGATWSPATVSFTGSGSAATMTQVASTDGTATGTTHSEIDSRLAKYALGTYASRIRFTDTPTGPTGAHVNETFFAISPNDTDVNYSEMDFEYLPAGGWGDNRKQLDFTSWNSPTDSMETASAQSYDGWHTLVVQATASSITYFVDGVQTFSTDGKYVVRESMDICFNAWFIDGELGGTGATRSYQQEVDWVYFQSGQTLAPAAVQAQVDSERAAGVTATDTVS
jgi:hypothetical protein